MKESKRCYCGKKFTAYISQKKKFCSYACAMKVRVGVKRGPIHSAESREKIGAFWRGKKRIVRSEIHRKKLSIAAKRRGMPIYIIELGHEASRGRKHTEDTKKKMSERKRGHLNINWKNGITTVNNLIRKSAKYREWREAVFKRDGYKCVNSKSHRGKIQADHIKPFALFPELRFDIKNGRTLCMNCHIHRHRKSNR